MRTTTEGFRTTNLFKRQVALHVRSHPAKYRSKTHFYEVAAKSLILKDSIQTGTVKAKGEK